MHNSAKAPSLWWRLSSRLSLVLVTVIAIVIVGLCVYGAKRLSPVTSLKDDLAKALDEALVLNKEGSLAIRQSARLQEYMSGDESRWFVASTPNGATISYGSVPAPYAGMAPYIRIIQDADIRGARETTEVASIDAIHTKIGEIRVMYGGDPDVTATFLTLLAYTYPIYVPLLVIALPALFLMVPRIVTNALSGLNRVVSRVPALDVDREGSRLPIDGVPREVLSLIPRSMLLSSVYKISSKRADAFSSTQLTN